MQGFLTDFFPWVKAGAKPGEQWADTSTKATTDGTDSVVVKRVTSYRVVGRETRAARKALRVTSEYVSTIRHPADRHRRARAHRGQRQGHRHLLREPRRGVPGRDWQLQSALTISGAFANEPLPITITQTTKVTPLP